MERAVGADRFGHDLPDPRELPRPWLAHYPPGVPPTYDYPAVPLTRFLDDAARDFPEVDATVRGRARLSYAELLDAVDRLATALAARGVTAGTRVAIVLPNRPSTVVAVFAVLRLGGVVVPIAPTTPTAELDRRLRVSGCEVVVADTASLPALAGVRPQLPRLRHIVASGAEDRRRWPAARLARLVRRRPSRQRGEEVTRLRDLLDAHDPRARQAPLAADALAAIVFGDDSDGGGALLTHANLLTAAFQARLWVPDVQAGRERVVVAHPLTSAQGLAAGLLASVLAAATVVLPPRVDAEGLVAAAGRERATLLHVGAELLAPLTARTEGRRARDLDALRVVLVAPGAGDAAAGAGFEERTGARVRTTYGRCEAPLTHASPVYGRVRPGRLGLPVTDTVATILDPADPSRVLPAGEVGVLAVHGPQVAAGVLTRDGPAPADGWLRTAEWAVMDDDGSFELTGGAA